MSIYTFICLAKNQVAGLIDIQELTDSGYRHHALTLLREHASTAAVEVWRDDEVVDVIDRSGAGIGSVANSAAKSL